MLYKLSQDTEVRLTDINTEEFGDLRARPTTIVSLPTQVPVFVCVAFVCVAWLAHDVRSQRFMTIYFVQL